MALNKANDVYRKYEKLKNDYSTVVFLDYLRKAKSEEGIYKIKISDRDINIENNKMFLSKLIKEGYAYKNKDVSIVSTVRGRKLISKDRVKISEKGKELLGKRDDWLKFFYFASPFTNIGEYERSKEQIGTGAEFETIMIAILSDKIETRRSREDYRGLKNLFLDIGELYKSVSYDLRAMYCFVAALYFDVSGIEYYDAFRKYMRRMISYKQLKREYRGIYIDPRILEDIRKAKEGYMSDMVDHIFLKNPMKINFYTKKRLKELVADIVDEKFSYKKWINYSFDIFDDMVTIAEKNRQRRVQYDRT